MRRVIAALLAFLLVVGPSTIFAAPAPVASVQALQDGGRTFCTAFSVAPRMWATAGHCAIASIAYNYTPSIMGKAAWIVYVDPALDIAVFESDATAPAVRLSRKAPSVGDVVSVVGYPYGLTKVITVGAVGARNVPIMHPSYKIHMASDILDLTVAGGNSGSPVFDRRGQVVGVLWGGFIDTPHALSIPQEGTYRALGSYAR